VPGSAQQKKEPLFAGALHDSGISSAFTQPPKEGDRDPQSPSGLCEKWHNPVSGTDRETAQELPEGYTKAAKVVAEKQAALAGYKLAASILISSSPFSGAGYAFRHTVPKVIYKASETRRGFITAMLAPVDCKQKPRFRVRQTLWVLTLAFGTLALMRLLLAH
jgi:hypothetical protein